MGRENLNELRQKADKFDQIQAEADKSKSEVQRLTERLDALTAAQAEADRRALRYRIAGAHGISTEDADLFLTGDDEQTIIAQAERLAQREKQASNVPPGYAPLLGRQPTQAPNDERAFVRGLVSR